MKHSEPLILNKEEFFEGFDNPSIQEKVVGVKIALLQNDNGEIGLGLGIEAPPLHSREIEEINRFFAKKVQCRRNDTETLTALSGSEITKRRQ